MKQIDETTLEIPDELKARGMVGVSLTAKYFERRGAADLIEIHVHQPDGREKHRMSKFRVTDAAEHKCAYTQTRGRSEPYDMAILGLNLYGWDCTNYKSQDDRTRREKVPDRLSHLSTFITIANNVRHDYGDDPLLQEAFAQMGAHAAVAHMLMEYRQKKGRSMYDALNDDVGHMLEEVSFVMDDPSQKSNIIQAYIADIKAVMDVSDMDIKAEVGTTEDDDE